MRAPEDYERLLDMWQGIAWETALENASGLPDLGEQIAELIEAAGWVKSEVVAKNEDEGDALVRLFTALDVLENAKSKFLAREGATDAGESGT